MTRAGTGGASAPDTAEAVAGALSCARAALGGGEPDLGIVFASPVHPLADVMTFARQTLPGADWVGCSSAGELTEAGATRGGISAMLISFGDAAFRLSDVGGLDDIEGAVRRVDADSSALAAEVSGRGWRGSTTLLLGDGVSTRFEHFVTEARRIMGVDHPFVGGGAGDDGRLLRTWIASGAKTQEGGVTALHVASAKAWGIGIGHGVVARTERMTVTRAEGNVVHEIDGRPAVEVFSEYAAHHGLAFDPRAPGAFFIENELGIYFFDEMVGVRAGLAARPDGGILYAGHVPEESSVAIVRGDPGHLIEAAARATKQARAEVDGEIAGVLVFTCVTRKTVLGDRYGEEIRAIVDVLGPGVPVAGYASYGEIATVRGKLGGYHNHTIVVAAIPA